MWEVCNPTPLLSSKNSLAKEIPESKVKQDTRKKEKKQSKESEKSKSSKNSFL
jgi:hypothetical protein